MSSSVCQGFQSCLEPRLVEPLVLRLRLAPPKPDPSRPLGPSQKPPRLNETNPEKIVAAAATATTAVPTTINRQNFDPTEGWSFFLQVKPASDNMQAPVGGSDHDRDGVYVQPPLMKRSHSMLLREKISLEMCTENLGNETGSSSIIGSLDDIATSASTLEVKKLRQTRNFLGRSRNVSFPPPLTSISGSTGVLQMRPWREGGRLVLEAVAVSSPQKSFHVERSEGRLRMRLCKDGSDCCCNINGEDEPEEVAAEDAANEKERTYDKLGIGRPCRFREKGGGTESDKGRFSRLEPLVVAS
ncbi:hypothetical protein SAY86_009166 [Trapa natans]|uniref:FAF domain-containing protein n=1 Tax=Trapa natans TaxID=22666 RepID=A0AAN7QCD6_TRANT|nr:hypothetical protein SAY86_009166 [Trapa natans]